MMEERERVEGEVEGEEEEKQTLEEPEGECEEEGQEQDEDEDDGEGQTEEDNDDAEDEEEEGNDDAKEEEEEEEDNDDAKEEEDHNDEEEEDNDDEEDEDKGAEVNDEHEENMGIDLSAILPEMTKVKKCGFQCIDSSAYPADWDSDWLTYTDDVTEEAAQNVTQSDIEDAYFDQQEPDSNCDQNQSHNVFYQVGEAAPVYTGQLLAMAMASQVQEVGTDYSEWETGLLVDVFGQLKKYREGDEKSKEVEPNRNMFFQSEGGPPVYTGQLLNAFLAPQLQDGGVEYFEPFEMSSYEPDPFSSKDCLQGQLPAETQEVKDLPADLNIEVKKVEVPPTDLNIEIKKGETLSQDVGVEVNKGEKLPENLSVKANKPVVKDDWDTVLEMALIF